MRVGISGHQHIHPTSAVGWVKSSIQEELRGLGATIGVSSLAAGSDQIFGSIVLEMNLELEVIIPCSGYESTFGDNLSRALFAQLNERAIRRHYLGFDQPCEQAFLEAGQRVVDTTDFMMFVWDGLPSRGLGGTADIVGYASEKFRPFTHLNPTDSSMRRFFPR